MMMMLDQRQRYFVLAHVNLKEEYDFVANPIKPTKLETLFDTYRIK